MTREELSTIIRTSIRAELAQAGIISQFVSVREAKRIYGTAKIDNMIANGQIRRYPTGTAANSKVNLRIEEILKAELNIIR